MLTLSVIGVEDGAIIAAGPAGERFRIPLDADLRARLREDVVPPPARRLSPKEIQAHVRAGLSAQQVAALAGTSVADVERFVGPVLAERAYVLETALAVEVRTEEGADPRRFAAVMDDRLRALDASAIAWTTLKEAGGPWLVAVRFSADGLQHDARWSLDLKRQTLAPENVEAATLSQQGTPLGLSPRLKAVPGTGPIPLQPADADDPIPTPEPEPEPARFDSAVFRLPDLTPSTEDAPGPESTSDLLDALAAKRGQRPGTASVPVSRPAEKAENADTAEGHEEAGEADADDVAPDEPDRPPAGQVTRGRFPDRLPAEDSMPVPEPARRRTRPPRRTPAPAPVADDGVDDDAAAPRTRPVAVPPAEPAAGRPRRTGRTSMPSWDEIVFGRDED